MGNGGICERLFALAKESLDIRDDPSQPSVMMNAGDIVFACRRLPPPPGGPSEAHGGHTDINVELKHLQDQVRSLQAENSDLRADVERLRREADQGSSTDMLNNTVIPNAFQSTSALELQGLQQLFKEVRRLKGELSG